MLAAPPTLVAGRTALDRADAAAQTGVVKQTKPARAEVAAARSAAKTALADLDGQLAAYRASLDQLLSEAAGLPAAQRQALESVAKDGTAEAAAIQELGAGLAASADTYTELDQAQATWLNRASAGWYRSTSESAAAYAVLARPQRTSLQRARDQLAAADGAREAASTQQQQTLRAADAALDPLRGAG